MQEKGEYNFLTKGHIFPKLHNQELYYMLINNKPFNNLGIDKMMCNELLQLAKFTDVACLKYLHHHINFSASAYWYISSKAAHFNVIKRYL